MVYRWRQRSQPSPALGDLTLDKRDDLILLPSSTSTTSKFPLRSPDDSSPRRTYPRLSPGTSVPVPACLGNSISPSFAVLPSASQLPDRWRPVSGAKARTDHILLHHDRRNTHHPDTLLQLSGSGPSSEPVERNHANSRSKECTERNVYEEPYRQLVCQCLQAD